MTQRWMVARARCWRSALLCAAPRGARPAIRRSRSAGSCRGRPAAAPTCSRACSSPKLSEALGQQIIVDNRGGAAGNIGAEMAAKSPPDGYTIVFAYSGTHSINPSIYSKMPFKESDFAPIIWLSSVPQVVVVHPSLPVKNVKELIALAKAQPGAAHLRLERQRRDQPSHRRALQQHDRNQARARALQRRRARLPSRCCRARSRSSSASPLRSRSYIKSGKLRAIAVTSGEALAAPARAADGRRVRRAGLRSDVVERHARAGGHPAEIVRRLNAEFNKIIARPT